MNDFELLPLTLQLGRGVALTALAWLVWLGIRSEEARSYAFWRGVSALLLAMWIVALGPKPLAAPIPTLSVSVVLYKVVPLRVQ